MIDNANAWAEALLTWLIPQAPLMPPKGWKRSPRAFLVRALDYVQARAPLEPCSGHSFMHYPVKNAHAPRVPNISETVLKLKVSSGSCFSPVGKSNIHISVNLQKRKRYEKF